MANERQYDSIGPVAFIADGGANGVVTVASVEGLRVKQEVVVSATSVPQFKEKLEIKKVLSPTKFIVGPIKTTGEFMSRINLSAYTLAANATIKVIEQKKSKPPIADIVAAVYEQEPVVAIRTFPVDEQGKNYNSNNPFPVTQGGVNLAPHQFDDVKIIRDSDDYPIRYEFYLLGVYIRKIDVTYNSNQSAIDYKGSDPL